MIITILVGLLILDTSSGVIGGIRYTSGWIYMAWQLLLHEQHADFRVCCRLRGESCCTGTVQLFYVP